MKRVAIALAVVLGGGALAHHFLWSCTELASEISGLSPHGLVKVLSCESGILPSEMVLQLDSAATASASTQAQNLGYTRTDNRPDSPDVHRAYFEKIVGKHGFYRVTGGSNGGGSFVFLDVVAMTLDVTSRAM